MLTKSGTTKFKNAMHNTLEHTQPLHADSERLSQPADLLPLTHKLLADRSGTSHLTRYRSPTIDIVIVSGKLAGWMPLTHTRWKGGCGAVRWPLCSHSMPV